MGSIASIAATAAYSTAQVNALTVDVGFQAVVGGKTYEADVIYSGGQYVADYPSITGAEATGTSLQTAENNLITRIDALV